MLSNTNSFIFTQLNGFKYYYVRLTIQFNSNLLAHRWSNSSFQLIDWTLTCTTTLGQSGPRSNGNKMVLHILQSSKTRASSSDGLVSYPGHFLRKSPYSIAPAIHLVSVWFFSNVISPGDVVCLSFSLNQRIWLV